MKSEAFEDMGEKELPNSGCIDGLGTWDNNHPLCKAVVDHNQDRIQTMYIWEISDEVNRELLKGERGTGGYWV